MTDDAAPAAFEVVDVRKTYGNVVALDGVSLSIAAGECVAIVGESGSGKTTLLRLFNRMVEPDSGLVLAGGEDVRVHDRVKLRRRIGYVPQTGGLLPHWRVLRNVALVPSLERHADPDGAARAALTLVGMEPEVFAHRKPAELSGGQRQRVAIARALAARPRYLLLDEAFSALDAITRSDVHDAFVQVRRQLPVTTLLVTHDLREAVLLADRTAVLRSGRLEQVGRTRDVVASPATTYVAELVRKSALS